MIVTRALFLLSLLLALAPSVAAQRPSAKPSAAHPAAHAPKPGVYPPIADYLMPRDAEIALARSAAPAVIADRATVKVLTPKGYEIASQGDTGAVCMVMRGFTAPTYTPAPLRDLVYDASIRAPICFAAPAARVVLPYYERRTALAMAGKHPPEIATAIESAYASGDLPRREAVTFAYMFSAHQHLGAVGAWHPHMMAFVPGADRATVGDTPFGGTLPALTDDAGTPFAVVVIPVGDTQFVKRAGH